MQCIDPALKEPTVRVGAQRSTREKMRRSTERSSEKDLERQYLKRLPRGGGISAGPRGNTDV